MEISNLTNTDPTSLRTAYIQKSKNKLLELEKTHDCYKVILETTKNPAIIEYLKNAISDLEKETEQYIIESRETLARLNKEIEYANKKTLTDEEYAQFLQIYKYTCSRASKAFAYIKELIAEDIARIQKLQNSGQPTPTVLEYELLSPAYVMIVELAKIRSAFTSDNRTYELFGINEGHSVNLFANNRWHIIDSNQRVAAYNSGDMLFKSEIIQTITYTILNMLANTDWYLDWLHNREYTNIVLRRRVDKN